ncbi:MAG: hypothetical protein AAFS10_18155 [Myxococcota bacterium]
MASVGWAGISDRIYSWSPSSRGSAFWKRPKIPSDRAPPPPPCEDGCAIEFEAFINECAQLEDPAECFREAELTFEACINACQGPPPPPCEEDCITEFEAFLAECEQLDDPAECFREAELTFEACLNSCQGPPPPPPVCEEACAIEFEAFIMECEQFDDPAECFREAELTFEACINACPIGCPPAPTPNPDECGDEQELVPVFDEQGCTIAYECSDTIICPPTVIPECGPGEQVAYFEDSEGCVFLECVPEGDRGFACGAQDCVAGLQYCEVLYPGIPDASISYTCQELPANCTDDPSCDCLISGEFGPFECIDRGDGALELQIYLP